MTLFSYRLRAPPPRGRAPPARLRLKLWLRVAPALARRLGPVERERETWVCLKKDRPSRFKRFLRSDFAERVSRLPTSLLNRLDDGLRLALEL